MSILTKEEVAGWIRNLVPYMENPCVITPEGYFDDDVLKLKAGQIIEYGDNLSPTSAFSLITQTENIRVLVDLYKSIGGEE
jgi:hypothetical protein